MKNQMKFFGAALIMTLVGPATVRAASVDELARKSMKAAVVLQEIVSIPDKTIPKSLLSKAVCIATIPDVIRAAFIFGGRGGQGLVSCRTPSGWSDPSFLKVVGGSWGFEIGISSIDTVLVFLSPNAVERLSHDNFTLGGDASIAAGPVGRDLQADTDYKLNTEIVSYSRAKGIFAGLALEGTSVSVDKKSNRRVYNSRESALELLTSPGQTAPAAVMPYLNALNSIAP